MIVKHVAVLAAGLAAMSATGAEAAPALVDAAWLEANLGRGDLVILDVRSADEDEKVTPYAQGHIQGAVDADYVRSGWRATVGGVPGELPPVADLERLIGRLGVDNDDHVILVHSGNSSSDFGNAARVYWTFAHLGHAELSILDGGQRAWVAEAGAPLERDPAEPDPSTYQARVQLALNLATPEAEALLEEEGAVFVDARPRSQYVGQSKAKTVQAHGHMPRALSLPEADFIDAATGKVKPRGEL